MGRSELAADMASLFALALIADQPVAALDDPHHAVKLGRGTSFSLHELLCELRSLPWHDRRNAQLAVEQAADRDAAAALRRAQRWSTNDELTLRSLFRPGISETGFFGGPVVSRALAEDHATARPAGPVAPPADTATADDWLDWCAGRAGTDLRSPDAADRPAPVTLPVTLNDLAEQLRAAPPGRPFYNAVLGALARGMPLDDGLRGAPDDDGGWTPRRLLSLMAEAERRAVTVAMRSVLQAGRPTRPVVMAARMTVLLARESFEPGPDAGTIRAAAEEMAAFAPALLEWISIVNTKARGSIRFSQNLFLPLGPAARDPAHPSDLATHAVVAGALATLTKAVFVTKPRLHVPRPGESGPAHGLAEAVDRLASNVCLARSVSATHYPAEDFADLRTGEALAMQLLRDAMERDNRSATLVFRNFDGAEVRIAAQPRRFGRGHATLCIDNRTMPWPHSEANPAAHLTAVV